MRASVDAVLVIRRGGEQLEASLRALITQTRRADRVCLVDLSADSTLRAEIDGVLAGKQDFEYLVLPFGTRWSEALGEAIEILYPGRQTPENSWMWLLRDDTAPAPSALEHLTLSVESAPLVRIAGPKQRVSDRPLMIREMGETMTVFGERIAMAERELDQAQYDRLSDVLAVGEAGMLVHSATLEDLEGFDPALSPLDGGLDLCVRARLAGHRVVVLPHALVDVASGPADWHSGRSVSSIGQAYLSRRAWLYRRFVYAPLWALLPLLLWALPWAIVRSLWHTVAKHPERTLSEVVAALWALGKVPDVLRARGVVARSKVTSWDVIDSLRMSPEDVRKRRGIAAESRQAAKEERALQIPRPSFFPAFPWTILGLAIIAGITHGRWWGSQFLLGGGLLPLPASRDELWSEAWWLSPGLQGIDANAIPADPFSAVLAFLGSLTWWSPSLAVVMLFLTAIPIAGAIAWWAASQFLSKAWTISAVAVLWALSPTLLISLSEGRIGAVIAHLTLPWLVASLVSAHESWQRVGQASLATLIVVASAPVLWPAVVLGYVLVALSRLLSHGPRIFLGLLPLGLAPSLVMGLPRFTYWLESVEGRWWSGWGVLFADPAKAYPYEPASWWEMAAGWPTSLPSEIVGFAVPSWSVLVIAVPFVVVAVLSLVVGRPLAGATFAGLVVLGLLSASASTALFSGYEGFEAVFVWAGSGVSVAYLGFVLGAGATLDHVDFQDSLGNALSGSSQWLARIASIALAVMAVVQVAPFVLATWSGGTPVAPSATGRSLPAFVAAEAAGNPAIGTLLIREVDDSYLVTLERGAGSTLTSSSSLVRGRGTELTPRDEDLARLVGTLVRPSAADPTEALQSYGIRFILLEAPPESEASLTLAKRPELVGASSADSVQLWQVPGVVVAGPSDSDQPAGPPGILWVLLLVAGIFAVPTERRAKAGSRVRDDALPTLGEETSDDL
jgi:GT2 family glycosyltransferase